MRDFGVDVFRYKKEFRCPGVVERYIWIAK